MVVNSTASSCRRKNFFFQIIAAKYIKYQKKSRLVFFTAIFLAFGLLYLQQGNLTIPVTMLVLLGVGLLVGFVFQSQLRKLVGKVVLCQRNFGGWVKGKGERGKVIIPYPLTFSLSPINTRQCLRGEVVGKTGKNENRRIEGGEQRGQFSHSPTGEEFGKKSVSFTPTSSFLDQIPVGLMVLGVKAEILFCNAVGCKLLQRTERELLGKIAFGAAWQVVQTDGTTFANPDVLLSPQENLILGVSHPENGELIWLVVNTQPKDSTGQVICTYSNITEIDSSKVSLSRTQARLEEQNKVLFALAKSKTITQGDLNIALDEITEAANRTLGVERVSVWLYNGDRSQINCLNLYERTCNRHSSGFKLEAVNYPVYFKALEAERTIAADDAYTDPRTYEFGKEYLPAVGVTSMLDAPIWLEGEMIGVVCHEHSGGVRHWTLEEENFAGCIADLISLAMEANQRQKAQQAQRQSEARFYELTSHIPGMIYQFVLRPDGSAYLPYASSYCREMFELEPENMVQNAEMVLRQIHPEDKESFQASVAISAQTLQPWKWEGRFITPSGKLKWLSGASRPQKLPNGEIIWDGVLMDITESKRTEAALAKRERYLATLVEVQRQLLADDTDGNCYIRILEALGQASAASRVYLFENQREQTGRLLMSQRAEWCAKGINPERNNPLLQNLPYDESFPHWAEVLERGEIITSIVAEQPEPEREILAAQEILSILVLPLTVNNQFWGFIGFDNCQEARLWDSLEVDLLAVAAGAVALHQERALAEKALSQAKDELEIQVEKRTKALKDANQLLSVEITERSAAQRAQAYLYTQAQEAAQIAQARSQELQQALEDLKKAQSLIVQSEKMSSLGQMVAGIAHEINNPIGVIAGNLVYGNQYIVELLDMLRLYQEHYPQPVSAIVERSQEIDFDFLVTDLPKLLQSMQVNAKRISDIVISLRNFSRLDEAEMKRVNLHEGIDNTLLILQHRLKSNGCHPEIEIIKEYDELPTVECYPGKLNQVFMNILNNAIDALEQSTVKNPELLTMDSGLLTKPQIRIRTEVSPAGQVCVRIADNGIGMSEQIKARIFDPFFTTKPVGSGTGLGLSISYQIVVENHKGTLNCTSELGCGTEFCIEIPIWQTINVK